uniref:3-oxo-5-alpha-steroid 4-dehydrogenase C-terminal domain-containing protein n=1 Tax=Kalanchoe fedtschenkoi TaxID=63787 RepID=A0A7N0RCF4_KALFE
MESTLQMLWHVFFPLPDSILVKVMCLVSLGALAYLGMAEVRGKHLQYSKFWNAKSMKSVSITKVRLSGKVGMTIAYAPGLLAALASFAISPSLDSARLDLLRCALALHFAKRIFELVFIHKLSSPMILDSALVISINHSVSSATLIYTQYLSVSLPEPTVDLKYIGVGLFFVGLGGNFYHNYLLAKLGKEGSSDNGYKIPQGGMFSSVICPHYLFEVIAYVGIAQTLYALSFALGTMVYLAGRSWATKKWYLSKFESCPRDVKCMIPFFLLANAHFSLYMFGSLGCFYHKIVKHVCLETG